MNEIESKIGGDKGFNAKNKEIVNMFEAGIVDPASVVKSSVKSAISVASTLLTTRVIVCLNPKPAEPQPPMPYVG